jgi:hypothetical protein
MDECQQQKNVDLTFVTEKWATAMGEVESNRNGQ